MEWILPLIVSSIIGGAGVTIAWIEHKARLRLEAAQRDAHGPNLVVESTSCQSSVSVAPVDMQRATDGETVSLWRPTLWYRADLSIINRSHRPNSIVSIELRISGIEPADWVLPEPSSETSVVRSGNYGPLLVPPIDVPAGVSTVKGEVAFDATLLPEANKEWAEMTNRRFALVLTDGYGLTYRTGAGTWRD